MILVSSFRPEPCPDAIWEHQIAANRSWERIADKIVYFNKSDARFNSAKTMFISPPVAAPPGAKPSIKRIAAFCGQLADWSAIVNADIVIPQNFRRVEDKLRGIPAGCAVSRRWTTTDGDQSAARLVDYGLDFFAATPTIWKAAAEKIPEDMKLGRIVWDNWMVNFFMAEFGNYCYDITPARVVFHPQHEDRVDQNWPFPKDDPILLKNNWPFHSVEI